MVNRGWADAKELELAGTMTVREGMRDCAVYAAMTMKPRETNYYGDTVQRVFRSGNGRYFNQTIYVYSENGLVTGSQSLGY